MDENENVSIVTQNFAFFLRRTSHVNLAELAVIGTRHDRDVRGMGLFLILRHKLLCIPVALQSSLGCNIVNRPMSLTSRSWVQITASFDNFAHLARHMGSEILRDEW